MLRLVEFDPNFRLKQLKDGDTVSTTERYVFAVNHKGINVKLTLSGNKEDIRKNFSSYKFDINAKTFIQNTINSEFSQKLLDEFTTEEDDEDNTE